MSRNTLRLLTLITTTLLLATGCGGCRSSEPTTSGELSSPPALPGQTPSPERSSKDGGSSIRALSSGRFIGQIDQNSVEIHLEGEAEPSAFRLSPALRTQFERRPIGDGGRVLVEFYFDEHGRQVATEIDEYR